MDISYDEGYYCNKCQKGMAGVKPKKDKRLCWGCQRDWYNKNKKDGCYGFKNGKLERKYVYYSLNQVVPNIKWKLSCFNKEY